MTEQQLHAGERRQTETGDILSLSPLPVETGAEASDPVQWIRRKNDEWEDLQSGNLVFAAEFSLMFFSLTWLALIAVCFVPSLLKWPGWGYFRKPDLRGLSNYRSLSWVDQQLRAVLDVEEREQILQPKRTPVNWSGADFTLHEGTRIHNAAATATYRKIYHDDDQIFGLQGKLIYRPQPGLEMPPVKVDVW